MTHSHLFSPLLRALWILALLAGLIGVPAQPVRTAHAASADCNIWWGEVLHDTFNSKK